MNNRITNKPFGKHPINHRGSGGKEYDNFQPVMSLISFPSVEDNLVSTELSPVKGVNSVLTPFAFNTAPVPEIVFGAGKVERLIENVLKFGSRVLIVTGVHSFRSTAYWKKLREDLTESGITQFDMTIRGEPSPDIVDSAVKKFSANKIEVVVGIGGGSVLDAAKAIAGLLLSGDSVMEYLEGVGSGKEFNVKTTPFIAVPTTAGTGSEITKNAVLSNCSSNGFKKSFRDSSLVAKVAIVDPELLIGCSEKQLAANGMDALTQLIESYLSINASPITDALAWSGMQAFKEGFFSFYNAVNANEDLYSNEVVSGRCSLAYASMTSGITLAQAGLGAVHGLASALGGLFPIPHGVVCGSLLSEVTKANIDELLSMDDSMALSKSIGISRYADVGRLLADNSELQEIEALDTLVKLLNDWTIDLAMPRLSEYGIQESDFDKIVANCRGGSMQTNPVILSDEVLSGVLGARL